MLRQTGAMNYMLIYRKGSKSRALFQHFTRSSFLPRSQAPALICAIMSFLISYLVPRSYLTELFDNPNVWQPLTSVIGFALVFRTNVAYNRYWEAATEAAAMAAKWGDACIETLTFDEMPRRLGDGVAVHDALAHLARRRHFQALLIRRFSLMHAVALQYLRRDDRLEHLTCGGAKTREPFRARAGRSAGEPAASRDQPEWKELEVCGGVTDSERNALEKSPDRVAFMFSAILDQVNNRRADGGVGIDAPILARIYQQISDGSLGFRQARKIEDVPFPFLYTQAITVFLGMLVAHS